MSSLLGWAKTGAGEGKGRGGAGEGKGGAGEGKGRGGGSQTVFFKLWKLRDERPQFYFARDVRSAAFGEQLNHVGVPLPPPLSLVYCAVPLPHRFI